MNAVVDRVVQYPHRYQLKNVNTGEVLGTFDLEPITGTISVVGTKIDKELFDSIASDLSARLVSNGGDAKDNVITFNMAFERSNVASGEKLSVSFGKIAKYFNDLKAVAFSGNKSDIGLGNVDNTADKDKPISTATKTALDKKANTSDLTLHTSNTSNPHSVTKSQVGLGNVDNTSDANKPVSTAQQQALNLKANASDVYTKTETDGLLNDKANANDVYSKTKTDELLNNKANKSDVYTKSESDAGLNKSLYNLGAYDTMVENSDGTYTITRQTGYATIEGSNILSTFTSGGTKIFCAETNIILPNAVTDWNQEFGTSNIGYKVKSLDGNWIENKTIGGIGGQKVRIANNDFTTIDQFKALCPINIQYKMTTSYTEKVEANHYARYNQRFILEHNKSEAERSANLINVTKSSTTNGDWLYDNELKLSAGTYTISVYANDSFNCEILADDVSLGIITTNSSKTFTLSNGCSHFQIYLDGATTNIRVMLNEGSVALPYQAYEGKVVHEKDLESITPGIFTKLGNKTNFSFDSGSYLVVANNGLVTVTGTDPLNVGSSAFKKFVGIFMVTIAEYDGGQSLRVNTEQVFFADYVSGTISGSRFTIYKLN